MGKMDPDTQEEMWERIKGTKTIIDLSTNDNGEVNEKPDDGRRCLRIVAVSDTHCQLGEMIRLGMIPDGDVLIHAGDITTIGDEASLCSFNEQLGSLPHTHKVIIAGNHELGFDETEDESQRWPEYRGLGTRGGAALLTNATLLQDQHVLIEGIKFYGASWHPLPGFPFFQPRPALALKWEKIPADTDVLITHTPPLGYRDIFPPDERWGCSALLEKVEKIRPRFHVFGHVHACYGVSSNGTTTFINAASEKVARDGFNQPIVFYLPIP